MGKIFSVEVEYAHYRHKAVVSVCTQREELVFHVQFMDSFLKELFQTEHLRYIGIDGYQYCTDFEDDIAEVVIERIGKAIEQKLIGRTALIRRLFQPNYKAGKE